MKTASLELSRQLKEAGFPQDSCFEWEIGLDGKPNLTKRIPEHFADEPRYFPAPTVDEILDQLPDVLIGDEGNKFDLNLWKSGKYWFIDYFWDEDTRRLTDLMIKRFNHEILVEAAAKMWLYLKKGEFI